MKTLKPLIIALVSTVIGFAAYEWAYQRQEQRQEPKGQVVVLPKTGDEVILTGKVTCAPTAWDGKLDCMVYVDENPVLIVGSNGFAGRPLTKLDLGKLKVWNLVDNEVTICGVRDGFAIIAKYVKVTP